MLGIGETGGMDRRFRLIAPLMVVALTVAACGGGGGEDAGRDAGETTSSDPMASEPDAPYVAQVASFELVAGHDQRFLAALAGNGTGKVVSFGSVDLEFFYLGTREEPLDPPEPRMEAEATFFPVAGQAVDAGAESGPREVNPSEGLGVYAASPVRFDTAGFWGVSVKATIDGRAVSANAPFEVVAESQLPFPGTPAPRTEHPVAGAEGVDPVSIDSRAKDGEAVPDPALHSTTVAAALAAGKPTVVVVSTPVYCVSRFCGPITDSVARLADEYGDRAAFVHLEVWNNFEKKVVNTAAAEWISPRGGRGDTQEPWVFLVRGDGIVAERFDNVVGDTALGDAVARLVAG